MKNVVILSLIFSPDNVSTAQIMAGLAEDLKKGGCGVKVVSTTPHFHRDPSLEAEQPMRWAFWPFVRKSDYHGVRVYHVPMPDKSIWPPFRLLSWIWFHVVSTFVCLFVGKIHVLVTCTPPITIGLGAWFVGVLKRCRYVFNVQEVYPDIAVNLGYMKNRLVIRFFQWLERFIYKHAAAVTTITPAMYEKIIGRVAEKGKVRLIPNYVEVEAARSASGPYQVFALCDDEAVGTNRLIELIAEAMGKKARLWRLPKGLMRFMARVGDFLHLPLNTERLGKLVEDNVVDNSPLLRALGWESMPVRAEDGFRATLCSFMV